VFTVTRTISEPARARSITWAAVAAASAVSVFVMDCTTTGYPPPTGTRPIRQVTLFRRPFMRTFSIWTMGTSGA